MEQGTGVTAPEKTGAAPKKTLGVKWLYAIVGLTLLFVLMPFLFWRMTWFGGPLTNTQLSRALVDKDSPRDIQHGLSQIADRIIRGDTSVKQFYPQVIALSASASDPIRTMAAWVMGQDNQSEEFHNALLKLLSDPDAMVERNAALGLVRFHDTSGHAVIVSMLKADVIVSSNAGVLRTGVKPGDTINPNDRVAVIEAGGKKIDVRSESPGRFDDWLVPDGSTVAKGQPIARILPNDDMIWESLRALYLIGEPADLQAIAPYARAEDSVPDRTAQQAQLTMEAIRERSESPKDAGSPQ